MPKYVIERDIPGVGNMSPEELNGASAKSCSVLDGLGERDPVDPQLRDRRKIYCIYTAPGARSSSTTREGDGTSRPNKSIPK
jgi:hypothetical protein